MTERDFLKSELLKALGIKLKPYDFNLNKSLAEYTKRNKDGWNKYQLVFLMRDEGWEINPGLLMRLDIVENIFHKFSGFEEKYKKNTPTIGTSIEDIGNDHQFYRFELTEESQINVLAENLYSLFIKIGLPFFDKFNSLKKIDTVLNSNPEDVSLTGPIFKGSKAIIIAKFTGRNDFHELKSFYYKYYEKFADGFYLPEYKELTKALEEIDTMEIEAK